MFLSHFGQSIFRFIVFSLLLHALRNVRQFRFSIFDRMIFDDYLIDDFTF